MFARVTTTQGSPDQFDQTVRYVQEQLIPSVKGMPGLKGAYWLGDRQAGKGLSITLWESAEAMQASEKMASQVRTQAVQATAGSLQSVERYEVVGQL
jgi:heme-degrading monooxygenase HmoA